MRYIFVLPLIYLSGIFSYNYASVSPPEVKNRSVESCCGANCIYIILRLNGNTKVSLKDIMDHSIVREKSPNMSLLDLKQILSDLGYGMMPIQITPAVIPRLKHPFIAHLTSELDGSSKHFVVAWAKNSSEVEIVDYPQRGTVSLSKLSEYFTGYAMISAREDILNGTELIPISNEMSIQKKNSSSQPVNGPQEEVPDLPQLSWIGGNIIDTGPIFEWEKRDPNYVFSFQNRGINTLKIDKIESSCSCAEAVLSSYSIEPGQYGKLRVKLIKKTEGPFTEYVRLSINDNKNPISYAIIKGSYIPMVSISVVPRMCDFGAVKPNRKYVKSIALYNPIRHPNQQQQIIHSIEIEPGGPITAYESKTWTTESNLPYSGIRKYEIKVEFLNNLPPGMYQRKVVLRGSPKDIEIPVKFTVMPPILCHPSICFFQIEKGSEVISKNIKFESDEDAEFTISKVSSDTPWVRCILPAGASEYQHKHSLLIQPEKQILDISRTFAKAKIKVTGLVNDKPWEVIIPIIFSSPE